MKKYCISKYFFQELLALLRPKKDTCDTPYNDIINISVTDSAQVQQALASCPNQTLLVIAHRLKTIEKADQIIVVGEGKVQERGTHQELMDKKGIYYNLREKLFTEGDSPK